MERRRAWLLYWMLTALSLGWVLSFGANAAAFTVLRWTLTMKAWLVFGPYAIGAALSNVLFGVNRAMLTVLGAPLGLLLLALLPINRITYVHVVPTFTPKQCAWILNQTLKHVEENGWQPFRQTIYPRAEISSHLMPRVHEVVYNKVYAQQLKGFIDEQYQGPSRPTGLFIVEYRPETQPGLPTHIDMGEVSWITLLNRPEDFDGGGTHFPRFNRTVRLEQGQSLVFPAKLLHEGLNVTRGVRYVLAGFATGYYTWSFSLLYLWGAYSSELHVVDGPVPAEAHTDTFAQQVQLGTFATLLIALLVWMEYNLDIKPALPPAPERSSEAKAATGDSGAPAAPPASAVGKPSAQSAKAPAKRASKKDS